MRRIIHLCVQYSLPAHNRALDPAAPARVTRCRVRLCSSARQGIARWAHATLSYTTMSPAFHVWRYTYCGLAAQPPPVSADTVRAAACSRPRSTARGAALRGVVEQLRQQRLRLLFLLFTRIPLQDELRELPVPLLLRLNLQLHRPEQRVDLLAERAGALGESRAVAALVVEEGLGLREDLLGARRRMELVNQAWAGQQVQD